MAIPSGTEEARPFIPARDAEARKAFYEALGFKKLLMVTSPFSASGRAPSTFSASISRNGLTTA